MEVSKVSRILEKNDRLGEQGIALVQSTMAVMALVLHLLSAIDNSWATFSLWTLLFVVLIITSSLYRVKLAQEEIFHTNKFLILTAIDGLLIFALLLSYNVAYQLELGAIYKSPSLVFFVIYTASRLMRFDPTEVLVAGGTVLGGWVALFIATMTLGGEPAANYNEYLFSQKLLVGAAVEMGVGFACFLGILAIVTSEGRRFVARTAMIDDLEEANRRAEQSADNFENLFASSTDAIIIVDSNGDIQRVNPSLAKLFGYENDELIGKNAGILMSQANAIALRMGIEHYLETGHSAFVSESYESTGLHRDGSEIPIELAITEFSASGETRFAGFIRDMSKRKQAELEQKAIQRQFQSAVDAAMDAIIIIDEDGIVTGYNPAAEEIFGFPQDEMIGVRLSETIIPDRYRAAHDKGMEHFLKTGEGPVMNSRIEIEGLHSSGEELQIELIIREIVGTDGRKFFGYARDITERKHNDEMLVQAKEEAEVATRAKARFLAFMTHEIRTSLNGMLGVVDLLGDTKLNSDQRQLIGVAEESGRSLIGIINDVLDFSKLEAGKFEIESNPFRLQLLLQSIRDLVEPQAEKKGLAFECNAPEELLQVYNGDADRIRQVLLNLIWNALKFTSDGKVSVNVNSTHRNKQPMLRFEVADTGIGIPDEKKQELFSEFSNINSTANNSSNSTGLGLAISKAFTLAMGGEIGFESAVQEGSVFWFEVPLELGEEKLLEQNSQIVFSPSFSGLTGSRILVADDNLTNQLIVKRYLRRAGAQVDIANNGKEAIAQFSKTRPDLVLMDISMPEMNGYEATAGIRYITNEGDHVPIIAFTAYAAEDDRKSIEAAGMDDHVTKPFSRDNLIATLLRHLPHLAADRQQDNGSANEGTDHVDRIAGELGLDSEILARTMVGLDEEAIGEVLTQFAADLARYCQLAQDGLQENDWGKVEKASHGMKGAAGMFGAIRLGEFSGTVNALCHDGAAKDIKHKTEQLVQEAQALLGNNRFESLVEELPSDSQKGSL